LEQAVSKDCCSEIKVAMDRTEAFDKWKDQHEVKQREEIGDLWTAINSIRNRLPNWATFAFSALFFLLGVAATLIVKG
jgi:hypothetical protein